MLVISAAVSIVLVIGLWAYMETMHVQKNIVELKEQTISNQKQKLKEEVNRVLFYLEYRKNDTLSHSKLELQNEVLNYFKDIRFGNDGYIFINTYYGFALLYDGQKLESPKNIYDLTDPNGLKIFHKELELAKLSNGGYFNYLFKKIYDTKPQPKLSFVKGFDDWGWIVGTGDYLDNITDEINLIEKGLKNDLNQNILIIIGVFISALLLLILIATLTAKSIQDQFNKLISALKQATLNKHIRPSFDRIFIRELKAIGFDIVRAEELAKNIETEADAQLQLSQQRYSGLFENAPISLWEEDFTELIDYLDEQLKHHQLPLELLLMEHPEVLQECSRLVRVLDVNKRTLALYDASTKEELFGNLNKVFTDDSFHAFKQSIKALYNGENHFSTEGKTISLEGKEIDALLYWTFLPPDTNKLKKVIVSVLDITELHKKEKQLKDSEARFRSIFENNHTVMFLVNPENGKFLDANTAALNYYGYTYEKFVKRLTIYDINSLSKTDVLTRMEEAKLKKQAYFNFEHLLANGEIRSVEVYSGLLNFEDKQVLLSIVHDITERKLASNELIKHCNELEEIVNERTQQLEEKNKALERINKLFVGRELRMKELKEEVEKLRSLKGNG